MQENTILVCITDQVDGEKLVKKGQYMTQKGKPSLKVLNIQNSNQSKTLKTQG